MMSHTRLEFWYYDFRIVNNGGNSILNKILAINIVLDLIQGEFA